jgi:CDP-paratose 2-epimerase
MSVVVVTGAYGLVGSEAVKHFCRAGFDVVGIDNDMRRQFFGEAASTQWMGGELTRQFPNYCHHAVDIRERHAIDTIFGRCGRDIALVVHTAAQPSHEWAARDPETDFSVNAAGTLVLLETTRQHAPEAVFIFTSTNKVYGDTPNRLPFVELDHRWELEREHRYYQGIDESLSVDTTTHSLFGVSKTAADLLVQEYGRYFGMRTACFRAGCITGPAHAGMELHGFLAYLLKCTTCGIPYTVFGYKGKQVRDNLHSADLVRAFDAFFRAPRAGAVYNIGGGRSSDCSVLEAIALCQEIAGRPLHYQVQEQARIGDHIWYVSDLSSFRRDYPEWRPSCDPRALLVEMFEQNADRWQRAVEARV